MSTEKSVSKVFLYLRNSILVHRKEELIDKNICGGCVDGNGENQRSYAVFGGFDRVN